MNVPNKLTYILLLFSFLGQSIYVSILDNEEKIPFCLYVKSYSVHWAIPRTLSEPISAWYGIGLENGKVVPISLFDNSLTGKIPESLGNLKHFEVLNLAFNSIQGTVTESLVLLKDLRPRRKEAKTILRKNETRMTATHFEEQHD